MKFFLLLTIISLSACDSSPLNSSSSLEAQSPRKLPTEAQVLWDTYVQEVVTRAPLQEFCRPIQLQPKADVPVKGLVVLYHGYSGCSIQFINSARKLSESGYHVLLPLLPGQGLRPLEVDRVNRRVVDDFSALPNRTDPYYDLALLMNKIAVQVPGYRFVGGLSGGGALAMASIVAGRDSVRGENIWSRSLLFMPLIKLPGPRGLAAHVISYIYPHIKLSLGQLCKDALLSESSPHYGICDFTLANLRAIESFGAQIAREAAQIDIPMQVIGVEEDGVSDNTEIKKFYDRITSPHKALCFYPKGVAHAIIFESDYKVLERRPWVPEVEANLLRFVEDGSFFETQGPSLLEPGTHLCQLMASLPDAE